MVNDLKLNLNGTFFIGSSSIVLSSDFISIFDYFVFGYAIMMVLSLSFGGV
jgi:hypothetical protein